MFHWRLGYILKSKWYTVHKHAKKSETLNILKICYRKLRSVRNLSAATCVSTRPVQQHLPSESAQRAVWILYAWRTVLSGTEAFPTRASGCCEHANSWTHDFQSADEACLWLRGTSESLRLVFGLRDAQAFFPPFFNFFFKPDYYYLLHFPFGCKLYVDTYCAPWETPCSLTGKIPIS